MTCKGNKLIFSGGKVAIKGKGLVDDEPMEVTFKLDPSKKPKAIDITEMGETVPGIYSIEGDTLKIYFCNSRGGERPTELKDGQNVNSYVLQRTKS